MAKKPPVFRVTMIKFFVATLVLNAFIVVSMLTSEPQMSPASSWLTVYYEKVVYRNPPSDEELAELHTGASELAGEECIACHGEKDHSDLPLHQIHLKSELLPGLECPDCHKTISLEARTNEYSVRLVDIAFCKDCHSAFQGLEENSAMRPEDFDVDCTTCHSGKAAFRHGEEYLSHVIAPKECQGCHGGRVLPWSEAHERSDWLDEHGWEALEVGQETCFQCHEFGLQFCEDCHSEKPPSHEPQADWLNDHNERARQDTRSCLACHEMDDCKACHINHESDWQEKHDEFVREDTAESCKECHSESFCGACHAAEL